MADLPKVVRMNMACGDKDGNSGNAYTCRDTSADFLIWNLAQIELKLKYKFRLILDETWSFGVLGRTGRGITEHQHVDAAEVDMIVGSMFGALAGAGGFCAGSDQVVEHQRLSALSYTYSAALPAMSAVTASETLMMLQTQPEHITQLRENIKAMWAQIDPRSDWMYCSSAPENPIMLLVLKPEVVSSRRLTWDDQQILIQEIVDEVSGFLGRRGFPDDGLGEKQTLLTGTQVLSQNVLITRVKSLPAGPSGTKTEIYTPSPALKVCVTLGLSKKEIEKAGIIIRHAITKVVGKKR